MPFYKHFVGMVWMLAGVSALSPPSTAKDSRLTQNPLITNGAEASEGQFPWQAAVFVDTGSGTAFCGGSLIAPDWVLTAAHCVQHMKSFRVVLGALHLKEEDEDGRQEFIVDSSNAHYHPKWNFLTLKNDIALLHLPREAELNDNVQVISLTSSEKQLESPGVQAVVSGWGLMHDGDSSVADSLQYVSQPLIANWQCNIFYMLRIRSSHLCMSGSAGKSTCQGDSGGPLVVRSPDTGAWSQVGIVSFGIAFGCEVGWPAVFTRVSAFLPYISQVTGLQLDNKSFSF